MKIKLDENLPQCLSTTLNRTGHETSTVEDEGLTGCADDDLWRAAQHEERFLITQDLDFSDIRSFVLGSHHGVLMVRLYSPSRQNLIERVESIFQSEDVEAWAGCFVVASERKIRVRRPSNPRIL